MPPERRFPNSVPWPHRGSVRCSKKQGTDNHSWWHFSSSVRFQVYVRQTLSLSIELFRWLSEGGCMMSQLREQALEPGSTGTTCPGECPPPLWFSFLICRVALMVGPSADDWKRVWHTVSRLLVVPFIPEWSSIYLWDGVSCTWRHREVTWQIAAAGSVVFGSGLCISPSFCRVVHFLLDNCQSLLCILSRNFNIYWCNYSMFTLY